MVGTDHETAREEKVWPDTLKNHVSDDRVLRDMKEGGSKSLSEWKQRDLLVTYLDRCNAMLTGPDFELIISMCQDEQRSMQFYLKKHCGLNDVCTASNLVEHVRKFYDTLNGKDVEDGLEFCDNLFDYHELKSDK